MLFSSTTALLALAVGILTETVIAKPEPVHGSAIAHRRHHARRAGSVRRRGTCRSKHSHSSSSSPSSSDDPDATSTATSSTSAPTTSSSSNSTIGGSSPSTSKGGNSTTSNTDFGLSSNLMAQNDVFVGFLPDDGDAGGSRETMASINSALGLKSAAYGWYAQAHSGTTFDGSQLLQVMDDVKACNCVFQPAVMPTGGWQGLTASDNSQAVAIAKVMKQFTDQGIEVWLRFAHEMNYYQTDGTYQGTASDFKAGWAAVAAAVRQTAPDVKMWWTPNVASAQNYAQYAPDNFDDVDLVGIDFYPKSLGDNTFVQTMQDFHDTYASGKGKKFAIGETGLGYAGSVSDRMSWLKQIVNAKAQLPEFLAVSWFNYQKGYNFKIVGESDANSLLTSFIKTG